MLEIFKSWFGKHGYSIRHLFAARELPSLAASSCFKVNYRQRKQNALDAFWAWAFHASVAMIARGLSKMVKWPEKVAKPRESLSQNIVLTSQELRNLF